MVRHVRIMHIRKIRVRVMHVMVWNVRNMHVSHPSHPYSRGNDVATYTYRWSYCTGAVYHKHSYG
jgi:hypothetical protein